MKAALLILPLALSLSGCIGSTQPLMGRDTRALPFPSGTKFELYDRDDPSKPWAIRDRIQFVADNELVVGEADGSGQRTEGSAITFHPLAPQRFLAQMRLDHHGDGYRYGLLEITNGEGILNYFHCSEIDQQAFRAKGGTVRPEPRFDIQVCSLDGAPNGLELVQSVINQPPRRQTRYVPVQ
jgi:hypothetical protein